MRDILIRTAFRFAKAKAMPIIKAYACKTCSTIGYISIEGNRISYAKCPCVKAGV
jgi:hypothetical protein